MIAADCTLITQLFLTTPESALASRVAATDDAWIVPPLWRSEFRSVLRKYLLDGQLSVDKCVRAAAVAESHFASSEVAVSTADVMLIVKQTRCSAYDAEYVSLALAFSVPLVTSDKKLQAAFPSVAISPAEFLSQSEDAP